MPSTLKIEGLSETVESLRAMGRKDAKRIVRKGLRAGARIVREAERAESPSLTGKLRKSERVSSAKAAPGTLAYSVGPRPKDFQQPRKKFYPAILIAGFKVRGGGRKIAANDFIERAFSRTATAAANAAAQTIESELGSEF